MKHETQEIFLQEHEMRDLYLLQESPEQTAWNIQLSAHSRLNIHLLTLQSEWTSNHFQIDLTGESAEVNVFGLAIARGKEKIENHILVNHLVPNCRSHEVFKYLLSDEAVGVFDGKVVVAQNAQKTEAYQSNRNLLTGNDCRMFAQPQLEIYADDVKCSHGMSTGQLDETALFYMQARGIPKAEAETMLKLAFANEVLQHINDEKIKEEWQQKIICTL
jgi:Fe-S cluster assembly protein SufD